MTFKEKCKTIYNLKDISNFRFMLHRLYQKLKRESAEIARFEKSIMEAHGKICTLAEYLTFSIHFYLRDFHLFFVNK